MPEDLPVTKRIDAMVGITRSKVILYTVVVSSPVSAACIHAMKDDIKELTALAQLSDKATWVKHQPPWNQSRILVWCGCCKSTSLNSSFHSLQIS
jgi:hypothetical protein